MTVMGWDLPGLGTLWDHGHKWIVDSTRRAIERAGVRVPIEALPEAAFVDPRVHAYFYWPDAPLPLAQLLVGFLPAAARPMRTPVVADAHGTVHLPGLGLAGGLAPHARTELRWNGDAWAIDGAAMYAPTRVAKIELATTLDPPCTRVLMQDEAPHELAIWTTAMRHRDTLARALDRLRTIDRDHAAELARDARLLVLFRSERLRSCANVSAYGAAFLQCERDATVPFFCEDIAHQVGHVTFYAVTADPRRCFRIPPATPMARIGGRVDDPRTLFDALHGNFTIARMIHALEGLLAQELTPLERAETVGRLAQAILRLRSGLDGVDDARFFTPEIWAIHGALRDRSDALARRHASLLAQVDLRGQPYVFSWSTFRQRNGLETTGEIRPSW
jgi:hypothetical protein